MRKKNKVLALTFLSLAAAPMVGAAPADVIHTGNSCKAEIAAIWAQRDQVALNQHKDFSLALGQASEQCEQLRDLAEKIKQAERNMADYQASLSKAQGMPGSAAGGPTAYPSVTQSEAALTTEPMLQDHSGVSNEAQLLGEAPMRQDADSGSLFPKGPNDGKVQYTKPK